MVSGTPSQRTALLAVEADITVISRDNLKDVLSSKRTYFQTLIIDELSGFKTKTSVRWKTANQLIKRQRIKHIWGLTGTPSSNGLLDLWGQIALLDQGQRLGPNLTTYRSRYFRPGRSLPNGVIIEWLLREGAADQIKQQISDLCLAMETDGRIVLPEITYNEIAITLPPATRAAYRELKAELITDLRDIFDGGSIHTAGSAATLTSRLSQMTSGFIYVDDADLNGYAYTELHKEKINALREVVEAAQGSPILVFYRYTAERKMIQEAFPDSWAMTDKDVVSKWNKGHVPMLVAHPASAGHGLNLQYGGHTIVWYSPTWDLEHWDQGNKRLARQGQKHPVVIHSIMARKSVDHVVRKALAGKSVVQNDLLAHLESPV